MERSCVNYITIAANTSVQDFAFVNPQDDYRQRDIKGIIVSNSTARIQCNVVYQGRVYSSFDLACAARETDPFPVELSCAAQQQPHIQFQDNTGSGASNVAVTLLYEPTGAP